MGLGRQHETCANVSRDQWTVLLTFEQWVMEGCSIAYIMVIFIALNKSRIVLDKSRHPSGGTYTTYWSQSGELARLSGHFQVIKYAKSCRWTARQFSTISIPNISYYKFLNYRNGPAYRSDSWCSFQHWLMIPKTQRMLHQHCLGWCFATYHLRWTREQTRICLGVD